MVGCQGTCVQVVGLKISNPMKWLAQRFELSRGGDASNVRPMEGLRGFAVFLVFLVHYMTLVTPWIVGEPSLLAFAKTTHTIGNVGVDLFFVLSGYLIYGSLISRPQAFMHFMSRRITRIYPAFFVVFVFYVALSFIFPAQSKIPASAITGILYLVANLLLLPGLFPIEPLITVAWSLSYEMFYYIAIPLFIALFRLRDRSAVWRSSFFLAITLATLAYCAIYGGPVRLVMFAAGILLFEAIKSKRVPTPSGIFGCFALVLGLVSTLAPITGNIGMTLKISILFGSFFLLCLTCFRDPSGWLPQGFSWLPLRWLGNMSYSYYLLHGLVLKTAFLALSLLTMPANNNPTLLFCGLLPILFAATLVPSAILYLAVERPFSLVRVKVAM